MGCDGGTIPKRNEIVKNKQKGQSRDKNADLSATWQFCSLSGLRLKEPIVSCRLGRMYNKDIIIEYLLRPKTNDDTRGASSSNSSASSLHSIASHIRSMKDVKTLNLKEKEDFDKTHQTSTVNELFKAQFTCPISGLDLNGKYKFYYLFTCGCVFSERALKEVGSEGRCILCSTRYDPDEDLIVLNGDDKEIAEMKQKLVTRRRQKKNSKSKHSTSSEIKKIKVH